MASTCARVLMTVWLYIVACVFFLCAFLAQVVTWVVLAVPCLFSRRLRIFRRHALSFIFQTCMGLVYLLMPFWDVKFIRRPPRSFYSKKLLIMCNHTSGCDPWILTYALYPWNVVYVVKDSLLRVPVAGWALGLAGNIPVKFTKERGGWATSPGSVKNVMERSAEVLEEGATLVVFPEGTRSITGRLQPFKDGFFRFALEQRGCQILPLAMHGNYKLWPVTSRLVDAGTAYVNLGDPIIPQKQHTYLLRFVSTPVVQIVHRQERACCYAAIFLTQFCEGMTVAELKEKTHAAIFSLLRASPAFDEAHEQPLANFQSTRGHGL